MIRRWTVIFAALGAIGMASGGAIGQFYPLCFPISVTDRDGWVLHFYDSRVRLFWLDSLGDAIAVEQVGDGAMLDITPHESAHEADGGEAELPTRRGRRRSARIRIANRRQVSDFTLLFNQRLMVRRGAAPIASFGLVRSPAWVPAGLLLIVPVGVAVRGPYLRRRRSLRNRRNQCLECGYDLTALTEPRCPECGLGFSGPLDTD